MPDWVDFWARPNAIYAGCRHLEAHARRIAADLVPYLPGENGVVLDFGCGEALHAESVAARSARLYLYDIVPEVRTRLRTRLAGRDDIRILDDDGLAALPAAGIDLIIVVSVVQYMRPEHLAEALVRWRRLLKPTGRLLVADVIDPVTPVVRDVASNLAFAAANGFLIAALASLARLRISDYGRVRRSAGFSRYSVEAFTAVLTAAGFRAELQPRNIGPSPHRRTFLATPA